ncbi:unnamed protein product [Moneuplotes crassus]|uniref:Nudix hydrolase domain-containing protein n=1 Tax=Euplotes crassus TaxID=5936 RepID=A0AAD1X9N9_EUPCR|nr:unnamed protein product [Moneuplotes crassus]
MASSSFDNQYTNFISICKGVQAKDPSMQPRVPHPHLVQHSMAIIVRLRKNRSGYRTESTEYIPPNYTEQAEVIVPDANPEEVDENDNSMVYQIDPGFIKLMPKLTEEKVMAKTILELKNRSVGVLPAADIDSHFYSQPDFSPSDCSVEYLLLRRTNDPDYNEESKDNRDTIFQGYTSLPGGVHIYGENSLDAVVRNTYEQTGYDLTDHEKFCLVGQSTKKHIIRYLPNKRVVVAKAFIFCQLVPDVIPIRNPPPVPGIVSMYMWSHLDFLYHADVSKHVEYREVTSEILKRSFNHVKLAQLRIANAENYELVEVVRDPKKSDPMFSLCGATLGMLLALYDVAPDVYDKSKYAPLVRKQFSIQLKRFNPAYFGRFGDFISKHTVHNYLINLDKKLKSDYEERDAEINYLYIYPTLIGTASLFYLIRRARNGKQKMKAKI